MLVGLPSGLSTDFPQLVHRAFTELPRPEALVEAVEGPRPPRQDF